jgi:hypothetical protein
MVHYSTDPEDTDLEGAQLSQFHIDIRLTYKPFHQMAGAQTIVHTAMSSRGPKHKNPDPLTRRSQDNSFFQAKR